MFVFRFGLRLDLIIDWSLVFNWHIDNILEYITIIQLKNKSSTMADLIA